MNSEFTKEIFLLSILFGILAVGSSQTSMCFYHVDIDSIRCEHTKTPLVGMSTTSDRTNQKNENKVQEWFRHSANSSSLAFHMVAAV